MSFLCRKLEYYGENTNLHALRYVADKSRHPCFRAMWLLIFVISAGVMLLVISGAYDTYRYNAISFVTETTYLDWNTTFPAVTICEITNSDVFWTPAPDESDSPDVDVIVQDFISDIIFFTGSCYSCSNPCSECNKLNFHETVRRYRRKCQAILTKCRWNNELFDCCERFLPLETEYGVCFSINSIHTKGRRTLLQSNRKIGPGELMIQTLDDVRMYFHAPEDVPFINSDPDQRKDVMFGEAYNITINVAEIENDENVKLMSVEQRGCKFPWEKSSDLRVHEHYSYSTCVVQCHADAHIRLCNCTHHLMPVFGVEKPCDIDGLLCLTDNFGKYVEQTVNRLHAKGFDKPGLVCDCVPSCVEPEYKVVSERKGVKTSFSEIVIKMQSLPTSRFKRNVVRTSMDLVGSIGGAFGLFIGGSLLSIIETIYLLFLRR